MELAVHHMTTEKHWADIVLNPSTRSQIDQLRSWLQQHKNIPHTKNKLRDGYRVLFLGPGGSGKSLSAAILAKEYETDVYKIDLSQVVSKYIGETEKNLTALFKRAEESGWILFFDEADALFGKRTDVKDAHDKYANQESIYLLQRIEAYQGLVIVAGNMKKNIDDTFTRRFHSIIYFPLPTAMERKRIWESGFMGNHLVMEKQDIDSLAGQYELSPGSIMNVVHFVKEKSSKDGLPVSYGMVLDGIKQESRNK